MIYVLVDNWGGEVFAGFCTTIEIVIHEDKRTTVRDDGRGIPVGIHPEAGVSAVELVLTTLHAGGKFDEGGYKVSGGLHGVGVSAVNALSEHFVVEVRWRDGKVYRHEFGRGRKTTELGVVTVPGERSVRRVGVSAAPSTTTRRAWRHSESSNIRPLEISQSRASR